MSAGDVPPGLSGPSLVPSFVRFVNRTGRRVDVIWLDYNGTRVKYKSLEPAQVFDVDTFVNHPWIFRDSLTHDRLVVRHREVFLPPEPGRAGPGGERTRRIVPITLPVYSLKENCFQEIRKRIAPPDAICKTEIPTALQQEFLQFLQQR
ncbi:von Hippel-Lindau disease tumor suppressor [Ixodes scapularis]|uniref:von hippel-lindau protein, putative n=1 Tax=Ixodes scapularis TaxID=6945 RepID=B7P5C9_IXOSC|nr:von Hippel-Lindau disease tumor suppressor [Ixodes scapularis]EEC01801.1 von hippel-lindau protein, putative [Ixodes scapularis]|eukprot:XP_002407244.1 von hippel-lindau protein, putative [Ixodes scapularis]